MRMCLQEILHQNRCSREKIGGGAERARQVLGGARWTAGAQRWSALIRNHARDNEACYGSAVVKIVSTGWGKGINIRSDCKF